MKIQAPGENQIHDHLSSSLDAKHWATGGSMVNRVKI